MSETLFINGVWREATGGAQMPVTNPATGEKLQVIASAADVDVLHALESAQAAFAVWSQMAAREKAAIMHRAMAIFRDEMLDDAARLLTQEHGKPLNDSYKECRYSADVIDYYADEARRVAGTHFTGDIGPTHSFVFKQPVGVVGAIVPWNFPVDLLAWKLGPGLAAGCTFVVKPSELAPFAAMKFVEAFNRAGIPDGVINVVTGGPEVGKALVQHPLTNKIAFTGSNAVGRWIAEHAGRQLKPVTLELGGSAPFIVCKDADLDIAVPEALRRTYSHTGQICISVNRIFVQRDVFEPFADRFAEAAAKLRVTANGLEDVDADMGPIITESGLQKVQQHVADAISRGATLCVGGAVPDGEQYEKGYFYSPTVLTDVKMDMAVMREETFGPVAPIAQFNTVQEAITMANDTPYGLAAYIYTADLDTAFYAARQIKAGGVGINVNDVTEIRAPFGGMKQSGLGRELGEPGLDAYMDIKHVRYRHRPPKG